MNNIWFLIMSLFLNTASSVPRMDSFQPASGDLVSNTMTSQTGQYAHIREALLLPENFIRRISDIASLQQTNEFQTLITDKIDHIAPHVLFYAYSSESVDDTEWGCAWRTIQTVLSSHFHEETAQIPDFKTLFETFGSREFLESQYRKAYSHPQGTWIAPHEDWHMWADPFVGQMIMNHFNIQSDLIALNRIVSSNSPGVANEIIHYSQLRNRMITHFEKGGYPLMIDNGKYALNILGIGTKDEWTFLLVADPHLKFEREDRSLNGLYVIELDKEGKQVSIDYPEEKNHFDRNSFETLNFTEDTSWMVLLPKAV